MIRYKGDEDVIEVTICPARNPDEVSVFWIRGEWIKEGENRLRLIGECILEFRKEDTVEVER